MVVEDDEVHFITSIGKTVAGNDCCTGVAAKCSYHHSRLYFLDAVK